MQLWALRISIRQMLCQMLCQMSRVLPEQEWGLRI